MIHPKYRAFYRVLGRRIAEVRRAKNWTQQDLGKMARCGQQNVCAYETGAKALPLPVFIRIADALEVSLEELVG